jgi:hypothetical protein
MPKLDYIPCRFTSVMFFETQGRWSVSEALHFLRAENYESDDTYDGAFYLRCFDDGRWLHVIEGWDVRDFSDPQREIEFAEASQESDIFWYVMGDSDYSFEYSLYSKGQCVRRLDVASPNFDDQVIRSNFGSPLPGEERILSKKGVLIADSPSQYVSEMLAIAAGLGANTNYRKQKFKTYRSPKAHDYHDREENRRRSSMIQTILTRLSPWRGRD